MQDLSIFQPLQQDRAQLSFTETARQVVPGQQSACARFMVLLERDFREHRSPEHYARRLGLSVYQLNQELRFGFGSSAYEMVQDRIHTEGLVLLRSTRLTVRQISFSLGISDPSWFTRCFRMREGCTPKQYRRCSIQNLGKDRG